MRNVFDQYNGPENRLTHALVCALVEDRGLLRRFIRWAIGGKLPTGPLQIVEQQRPGEPAPREDEASGIPDAWIFNDQGWALLIESKIAAPVSANQLRRHVATAVRRGFPDARVLTLTARADRPRGRFAVASKRWTDVYRWLLRERRRSDWAARCASYMEILESNLIEQGYLKEGAVTTFAGIPFNSDNPYNYLEAKRLLKLLMDELRKRSRLKREAGMDPSAAGRGAITGREGMAVWDFLRLRRASGSGTFTAFPHLTIAIERDRLLAIITVPNGIKSTFRRRLVDLGSEGFSELLRSINQRLLRALRSDKGAAPIAIVVQRRYPTQRSSAILDAILEFDMRTAFQASRRGGNGVVKPQPQWLAATYGAMARKRSNLQLAVGASFPYARSSSVTHRAIVDRVVDTWIACKPLLATLGLK